MGPESSLLRVGGRMRDALRILLSAEGAGICVLRMDLANALSERHGTSFQAGYQVVARLQQAGFIETGRVVRLTEWGRRYTRRRITWWGGVVPPSEWAE